MCHLNQDLDENLALFCKKEGRNLPGKGIEYAESLKEKVGMSRNMAGERERKEVPVEAEDMGRGRHWQP